MKGEASCSMLSHKCLCLEGGDRPVKDRTCLLALPKKSEQTVREGLQPGDAHWDLGSWFTLATGGRPWVVTAQKPRQDLSVAGPDVLQGFSASAPLIFWTRQSLWRGGCPVHCSMCGSISGLWLLNDSGPESYPSAQSWQKVSPDISKCPRGAKITLQWQPFVYWMLGLDISQTIVLRLKSSFPKLLFSLGSMDNCIDTKDTKVALANICSHFPVKPRTQGSQSDMIQMYIPPSSSALVSLQNLLLQLHQRVQTTRRWGILLTNLHKVSLFIWNTSGHHHAEGYAHLKWENCLKEDVV